jgi:hypothetical protein
VAGDVAYGQTVGPIMGDTCHHCKGDTWHGMTSAADSGRLTVADTWQGDRAVGVRGRHVDQSVIDTWQILVGC